MFNFTIFLLWIVKFFIILDLYINFFYFLLGLYRTKICYISERQA